MPTRVFLTAEWRHLAMLNYEVDPALLRPHLPAGTELDEWDGAHLVSVVGFRFLRTRVLGVPIPFHRDFDEVNLRFYVRRKAPEGWRRGVVFIKEIVPRWAIAAVARAVYNEQYIAVPMWHRLDLPAGVIQYGWRHQGRWSMLDARVRGEAAPLESGSEAEFITEHYWGYTRQRDGGTIEYQVQHPRWNVWKATSAAVDADIGALYGPEFVEPLGGRPRSAFVADGSAIQVHRGERI